MAIILCPECKREVSDKAPSCPHCGYVINPSQGGGAMQPPTDQHKNTGGAVATIVIVSLVILALAGAAVWYLFLRPSNDANERTMYENIVRYEQQNQLDSLEDALNVYLDTYSNKAHYYAQVKDINNRFTTENADWKSTERIASVDAVNKFLDEHPNGFYRNKAYKLLDSLTFADAQKTDTREAYENYVNSFPEGQFVNEAKRKIEELEKKLLTEEEKQNVEEVIEKHFEALSTRNVSMLQMTLANNIRSYIGKTDPTEEDIIAYMNKLHQSGNTIVFQVSNEQVTKVESGNRMAFNIQFSLKESIYTYSLLSQILGGDNDEPTEVKRFKGTAIVNEGMKITSLVLKQ